MLYESGATASEIAGVLENSTAHHRGRHRGAGPERFPGAGTQPPAPRRPPEIPATGWSRCRRCSKARARVTTFPLERTNNVNYVTPPPSPLMRRGFRHAHRRLRQDARPAAVRRPADTERCSDGAYCGNGISCEFVREHERSFASGRIGHDFADVLKRAGSRSGSVAPTSRHGVSAAGTGGGGETDVLDTRSHGSSPVAVTTHADAMECQLPTSACPGTRRCPESAVHAGREPPPSTQPGE